MSQFTQLNLQGNTGSKAAPKSGHSNPTGPKTSEPSQPGRKHHPSAGALALSGSLVAAALVAVLTIGTNGCSKSNKPAIAAPSAPLASILQPPPAPMNAPATGQAAAVKPLKKSARQSTVSTYKNTDYGISFRYPKTYSLAKNDKANLQWDGLGPVEMNFAQPGGTTVAAVTLPDGMYRGTDLASAFFTVSVNSKLTANDCKQFAFQDAKPSAANDSEDDMDYGAPVEPTNVNLGAAEFTEVESSGGEATKHADAKYYHVFQNGACYEFALGLQTDGKADTKPVNQNAVFGKLNWMLSTVKITATGIPAKTNPAVATMPNAKPAAPDAKEPTSKLTATSPNTTTAAVEGGKN